MLRRKLNLFEQQNEGGENNSQSQCLVPKKHKLSRSNSNECLDLSLSNCIQSDRSKYFPNANIGSDFISQRMITLQRCLNNVLSNIPFLQDPICYVYNPTIYAVDPYEKYLKLYCNSPKKIIFLGMNPGPWGMCQTGIPFGEVNAVRDWLQIEGIVGLPENVCEDRQIKGFNCERTEVSGKRFWNFFKQLCVTPTTFFKNAFVYNYSPIALLKKDGGNITPVDMKNFLINNLEEACDKTLIEVIKLLKPEVIVGIGRYAEKRVKTALKNCLLDTKVIFMPHPSPRSVNNTNWPEKADHFIKEHNLTQYFQ